MLFPRKNPVRTGQYKESFFFFAAKAGNTFSQNGQFFCKCSAMATVGISPSKTPTAYYLLYFIHI